MDLNTYIAKLEALRQLVGGETRVVQSAGTMAPMHAIRDIRSPIVETLQVKTTRESYEKVYRGDGYSKVPVTDSGVKVVML